jgi:CDP-4-dehydro-6-deoxyglucose reductase, E3
MHTAEAFDARLVSARSLSPNVRELSFERTDGKPLAFDPGQWLSVRLPITVGDQDSIKRSYSIASAPEGTARFEIALTRVKDGPGSAWLCDLAPGAILPFLGPHGFFTRKPAEKCPALFVATGTGITPMRSMLRAAASAGATAPVRLLFGVRREADLIYRDEFETLARDHGFLRVVPTLSQPDDAWSGRRGYVQTHVRELWGELTALGAGDPHAYVCGLERMIGSVRELLRREMGVARQQVHTERYD